MSTTWVSVLNPLLVTDGTVTGNGIFDIWMRTLGAHLKREYAEQRITGDEYAKAYISLMNNLLNTAVGFLTQDAQLAMSQEQMRHDITISDAQLLMAQTKLTHDIAISDAQLTLAQDKLAHDIKITDAQLVMAQTKLGHETQLLDAQVENLSAQVSLANKELILKDKDLALKEKQVALAAAQIKAAEVQYKDTVDGQPVGGVLGKQMKVYDAQAKGFKDNALQAATKIMVDTWNIRRQTEESLQTTADSKLYDRNIGNAIAEMFSSVSIPVASPPSP